MKGVAAERPSRPAGAEVLLSVSELSKSFGGVRALERVSFDVREGELIGVIGPNGAGKTTLFALLSGFLSPTSGRISFRGTPTASLRSDRLCRLGMARTFQVARPFAEMTVEDNVRAAAVFGKGERPSAARLRAEVGEVLAHTGLSAQAGTPARSLSLPQRKRLELARAIATRPRLLLLDEALAGLNPRELEDALPLVRSLNADRGIAILLIEHNLRAVMGLSKRVLVLDFGRLIFDGKPGEAVADPGVVRAYLGSPADA
jgi:branched-chain amino acid transport system ATP-binding protein